MTWLDWLAVAGTALTIIGLLISRGKSNGVMPISHSRSSDAREATLFGRARSNSSRQN
jgi:hypothetical protein